MEKWEAFGENRRFVAVLLCVSLSVHVYMGLILGAKYWFDSLIYFQLAEGLTSQTALRSLYAGPFGVIFQHLGPGLSLLILMFDELFGQNMWPAFAVLQNAIDVFASIYLATGLSKHFGRPAQLAIVILIPLFPYFSAFHNAILTESLTSSLVMIMVGATVRCLEGRLECLRGIVIVLFLGAIGAQIRSYVIGIGGGLALLIVFFSAHSRRLWLYLTVGTTMAFGFLVFPLYRVAAGIEFFLPNADALMLMHAHYVNWDLDERSRRAIEHVVLDTSISSKLSTSDGQVEYHDVVEMVDALVKTGMGRQEAIRKIGRAGWVVRTQSWAVMAQQLQLSMSSLGFQWLSTCCEPKRVLAFNDFTAEKLLLHLQHYYRWNAGLDSSDYAALFQTFGQMYRATPYYDTATIDWYIGRVGPFIVPHPGTMRDPLKLSKVPPDIFILAGLAGFFLMARRDRRLVLILLFIMSIDFAASLSAGLLGDNRYSHFLWPFYAIGSVAFFIRTVQCSIELAGRAFRWKKHRHAWPPS